MRNTVISTRNLSRIIFNSSSVRRSKDSGMANQDNHRRKLRVLLDMDGVLCNFEGHMLRLFREKFPEEPYVDLEKRNTFFMHEQFEKLKPGLGKKIKDIMHEPEFFLTMPEITGAVAAAKEMSTLPGIDAFICTSPITEPRYCAPEKYKWIQKHFGDSWVHRTILTSDKTLINGDILIDDRHFITGVVSPTSWDHILFSQCHNKHLDDDYFREHKVARRLENWTDGTWRSLVKEYQSRLAAA